MRILVTGATGYIGGRLVRRLRQSGYPVRLLVRDPDRVVGHRWLESSEVVKGDFLDKHSLARALDGIDTVFYLIHSMTDTSKYEDLDRQAALNMTEAGRHLKHIIYLGGLLPNTGKISRHLRSRAEVGEILRHHLTTTEFRAGPIIGSGSASFEMVRYLTERLPVMIAPWWIRNPVQPIAIRAVLSYLVAAIDRPETQVYDIGSERLTFLQMLESYAAVRGLNKRMILTVPPLIPANVAAYGIALLTPIPKSLSRALVHGIIHPVIADTTAAEKAFPQVKTIPYTQAVRLALERIGERNVATTWRSAKRACPPVEVVSREGLVFQVRHLQCEVSPDRVFQTLTQLGGDRGWLRWNAVWRIRGFLDTLFGGPGLKRGRRDPVELLAGDVVDFWRVRKIEAPRLLRLEGELKLPGRAWLQWEIKDAPKGCLLIQKAVFAPLGLWGMLYWYGFYPIHNVILGSLARAIIDSSKKDSMPDQISQIE